MFELSQAGFAQVEANANVVNPNLDKKGGLTALPEATCNLKRRRCRLRASNRSALREGRLALQLSQT